MSVTITNKEEYPLLMDIKIPMSNLNKDSQIVIDNVTKMIEEYERKRYHAFYNTLYNAYLDDDDDWDNNDYDISGWQKHFNGFGMTDEEWKEWQDSINEYEATLKHFEQTTGHIIRGNDKNKKGFTSQKFINGIEVDDETFEAYNKGKGKQSNTKHTRRSGRKHKTRTVEIINGVKVISSSNKKKKTRYVDDDWWDFHERDADYYNHKVKGDDDFATEKKIIFYRNLPDTTDTYEWDNLYEFDEWARENDIIINDGIAYDIMYAAEVHCCLDPDTTDKELIMGYDYDELVYKATNGDLTILEDSSNHWNYHGL